ncbi:MAG: hypothetical protein DIU83_11185 [Bacillota bacterium]|nr:MAG: hypothetical protein DIU83_11185 [Bacillota bacterium]
MADVNQPAPRWLAILVILVIAGGLAAWEIYMARSPQDTGVREVAVVLTEDGPFPDVLYVEEGVHYRIAVASMAGEHTLTGVTPAQGGRGAEAAARDVTVRPGQVVWLEAPPASLRDGSRLGGVGPVIERVDRLSTLTALGIVYPVAIIATDEGMVPSQVRLAEGSRAWVAGVSLGDRRILNIAGTNIKLFVWPDQLLERSVDTPAPGTYKVVCEEGCDDGWNGAVRIEVADMPIPWVESRDTDAAAQVNRRAPDFAVYDLEGRVVQLSDFRGEKPVFINFWATWCPPCMREMPEMQRLYAARGDEFEILAVNFLEHRPQVIPWVEEYGLEFPILMDVTGEVSSRYGVWSYPTSVFIDKDGIVRGRFVGELSYQMMEDFVDAISEYKAGDT